MKKFFTLALLIAVSLGISYSQTTTVTATVVDSDTTTWINGTWNIEFKYAPGYPNLSSYKVNGASLSNSVAQQKGTTNGSGILSVTVYDSSLVTPIGSGWVLTICPNASSQCGQYQFQTAGSSNDISAALTSVIPAPRFKAVSGTYGYADVEATTQITIGAEYWNVVSSAKRCYNGSAWAVCSGSGSGNVTPSPQFSLFYQPNSGSSATAQGDPHVTTDGSGNVIMTSVVSPSLELTTANPAYGTCDPTDVADSSTCMSAAITDATNKGIRLHVLHGTYKLTSAIIKTFSGSLDIAADEGTVFDFSTSGTNSGDLQIGGPTPTLSAALGGDVTAGANSLTTTLASSLVPGSIILISSTVPFDPGLGTPSGEMQEVQSIAGTTVTLRNGLFASYTAATTTIRLLNMPTIRMSNITFKCNPAVDSWGLSIYYSRSAYLSKVDFAGCQERSLQSYYTYGGVFDDSYITGMNSITAGTNYGFMLASSQYVTISNSIINGGRVAADLGGAEPSRNITYVGNTFSNLSTSSVPALHTHGNAEFIKYIGNTSLNGIGMSARNVVFDSNTVWAPSASLACFYLQPDIAGDYYTLTNNSCRNASYGVYFAPLSSLTYAKLSTSKNDFSVAVSPVVIQPGVSAGAVTLSQYSSVDDRMKTSGSYAFQATLSASSSLSMPSMSISGGNWDTVLFNASASATDLWVGSDASFNGTSGGIKVLTSGLNSFTSDGAIYSNATALTTLGLSLPAVTDSVILRNNRFVNMTSTSGINVTGGCVTIDSSNRYPSSTGAPNVNSSPACASASTLGLGYNVLSNSGQSNITTDSTGNSLNVPGNMTITTTHNTVVVGESSPAGGPVGNQPIVVTGANNTGIDINCTATECAPVIDWIPTSANAAARGWAAYPYCTTAGDYCITVSTTKGGNPVGGTKAIDLFADHVNFPGAINGPAARKGTFTCTSGGTITITNSNYIATSDVIITNKTPGGTITYAPNINGVTPNTGFTVLCASLDTSVYTYDILN